MMTPEQLDNHFSYHAPTEETAPKYAAIRAAEFECRKLCGTFSMAEYTATPANYHEVNATMRTFAEIIDANAPDSADKAAAIRCVRLARNAINEHLASCILGYPVHINMLAEASRQLVLARFQANSAIACGGK
jgi:hypothetical protein